jgi:large subunit ribosomal protein L23
MSIFNKKTTTKKAKTEKSEKALVDVSVKNIPYSNLGVIINPRVTEKTSSIMGADGASVYAFNVREDATKGKVKDAVKALYKVSPVKVSILPVPKKTKLTKGKMGVSGGGRKAYVYLKKGDKLEIA